MLDYNIQTWESKRILSGASLRNLFSPRVFTVVKRAEWVFDSVSRTNDSKSIVWPRLHSESDVHVSQDDQWRWCTNSGVHTKDKRILREQLPQENIPNLEWGMKIFRVIVSCRGVAFIVHSFNYSTIRTFVNKNGVLRKQCGNRSEIIWKVWVLPKCESSYLTFRAKALHQREKTWEGRKTRNMRNYRTFALSTFLNIQVHFGMNRVE